MKTRRLEHTRKSPAKSQPWRDSQFQPESDKQLEDIWKRVKEDVPASNGLRILRDYGWDPETSQAWRRIVMIPFLPNRRTRSKGLKPPDGGAVIRFLKELAKIANRVDCSVEARNRDGVIYLGPAGISKLLEVTFDRGPARPEKGQLAAALSHVLTCNFVVTEHNMRHRAIAGLCYEVREATRRRVPGDNAPPRADANLYASPLTGSVHETELSNILAAVFRAAFPPPDPRGEKWPGPEDLRKSLQHETEIRKARAAKLGTSGRN